MQFIDTHTHIYDEAFDADRNEVVRQAILAGVDTMLLPAIDSSTSERQQSLAAAFPNVFYQMAGLHPTSVNAEFEKELDFVEQQLRTHQQNYVAIGEIGLDFYWDRTFQDQQIEVLRRQMCWAESLKLPVALHVRKAYNELFALLRQLNFVRYRGVMHCFGGGVQEAWKSIEMGFYIGVGGVVTFKNASLANVVAEVPLDRIVLETDSPYLAPVPFRGRRNESAFVVEVAKKIAQIKNLSLEEVAAQTSKNAKNLFGLN